MLAACFHGGVFFKAIGEQFDRLHERHRVINADVLDAWFPPSPRVLQALREHLPWLLQTSPPTYSEGLTEVVAACRGVEPGNILAGAGSSDLIFLALRAWLDHASRVLLLDPTYGEYAHVLERIVGCAVDRLVLRREESYRVDPAALARSLRKGYDLVVLVNPNSPTGQYLPRHSLEPLLADASPQTRIWIDETYLEYVGAGGSLETFAARSPNVVVCKSMSKVYALSGVRAAYLCAAADVLAPLRRLNPPWAVSLPAQVAAVHALQDPAHYAEHYRETHALRLALASELHAFGWDVVPGCANFLLAHLPTGGPTAAKVVEACQRHGLFLRDAARMGTRLGPRAIRIAVKDAVTNRRMLDILCRAIAFPGSRPRR